ncbi:tripeptidyl aminopeptidase [Trichoderma cornu-damae]|uniref:Tripeptidyl aminopeptidase n=1 Tax=Trichoderma cornu-damae TaxID=654480 RepID=A0A9P8TU45_9HYPO|nr:tripeptidyl aminopeptidase [Trichoderma cornu-damae]
MRAASNSTTPKGSVFLNPGGPGGSGIQLLLDYIQNASLPAMELLRDYHLVGLDPRGVGQSTPIRCNPKLWNERVPSMVQTQAEYTALVEHWKAVGESCKALTGPLFDHMDTVSVARDFDRVRRALGEDTLNLVGLSYGTQIGYTYAELFPHSVGRMLLDGVVDHGQRPIDTIQSESTSFEKTLQRFFTWCQQETSCSLHGQKDVEAFFRGLAAQALAKPLLAPRCKQMNDERACRSTVSLEELMARVQESLTPGESGWGALADSLLAASEGDASALSAPYFTGETDATGTWASLAVGCQDWDHAPSFADLRAVERATNALSPITLGYTQSLGYYARCISWPAKLVNGQRRLKSGIAKAPAMLLANSLLDPETSVQWAVSMRQQIPHAVLVFRNGAGHTSYNAPGAIAQAMNKFLLDGKLPEDGMVYQS